MTTSTHLNSATTPTADYDDSQDLASGETCEVCDKTGKAAKRCAFGARSGPCSCWRGTPCK